MAVEDQVRGGGGLRPMISSALYHLNEKSGGAAGGVGAGACNGRSRNVPPRPQMPFSLSLSLPPPISPSLSHSLSLSLSLSLVTEYSSPTPVALMSRLPTGDLSWDGRLQAVNHI